MATAVTAPSAVPPARSLSGGWTTARRARLGSLRFGGEAMTRRMCEGARVGEGSRVVDLAPGYGATGALLNDVNLRSYTAVCLDDAHAQSVRARVTGPERATLVAAPDRTGLPTGEATSVVGEGLLTGVSDPTKRAILAEAARILRPGGLVAFHELCALRNAWSSADVPLRSEFAPVGLRPLDEEGWRQAMYEAGLEPLAVSIGTLRAPGPRELLADAGRAHLRQVAPALLCPGKASRTLRRASYLLDTHRDGLASVVIVGRRPVLAQV